MFQVLASVMKTRAHYARNSQHVPVGAEPAFAAAAATPSRAQPRAESQATSKPMKATPKSMKATSKPMKAIPKALTANSKVKARDVKVVSKAKAMKATPKAQRIVQKYLPEKFEEQKYLPEKFKEFQTQWSGSAKKRKKPHDFQDGADLIQKDTELVTQAEAKQNAPTVPVDQGLIADVVKEAQQAMEGFKALFKNRVAAPPAAPVPAPAPKRGKLAVPEVVFPSAVEWNAVNNDVEQQKLSSFTMLMPLLLAAP
jgi:hypothetical protein